MANEQNTKCLEALTEILSDEDNGVIFFQYRKTPEGIKLQSVGGTIHQPEVPKRLLEAALQMASSGLCEGNDGGE